MQTQERALAGRDSEGTHTELSRFTSTHTFTDPLSTLHGPLSNQQHLAKSSSIFTAPFSAQDLCPDPGPSYPLHCFPTRQLVQLEFQCKHTFACSFLIHKSSWVYQHEHTTCLIHQPRPEASATHQLTYHIHLDNKNNMRRVLENELS